MNTAACGVCTLLSLNYDLPAVIIITNSLSPLTLLHLSTGRVDSMDPQDVTPDGRLPEADKGRRRGEERRGEERSPPH